MGKERQSMAMIKRAAPDHARLREIADLLDVPLAALYADDAPAVLHIVEGREAWLLVLDDRGRPVVRHVALVADVASAPDESIANFLAQAPEEPPQRALADFIDGALRGLLPKGSHAA